MESPARTAVTVVALVAAVTAKRLRDRAGKIHESSRDDREAVEQAERLRMRGHLMHVIVPAATGWLLYSHLKQDMHGSEHVAVGRPRSQRSTVEVRCGIIAG